MVGWTMPAEAGYDFVVECPSCSWEGYMDRLEGEEANLCPNCGADVWGV